MKALMLPMGMNDWEERLRCRFMMSVRPLLAEVGMTFGIELKGGDMPLEPGNWVDECCHAVKEAGGVITWHPPAGAAKQLGDSADPPETMVNQAKQAKILHEEFGLKALIYHLRPAVSVEPAEDAGLERYNSPISAAEMLAHIQKQIEPLRRLNEISGGIISTENVDNCNFREGGHKVPTYLALQTGSWKDASWIKQEAGVMFTLDCEHFYGAQNLLMRREDLDVLLRWRPNNSQYGPLTPGYDVRVMLAELAGYWLEKGLPPLEYSRMGLADFLRLTEPQILHLGASRRAVMKDGTIGTHLPFDIYNEEQMATLDMLLEYFLTHDDCFSAVIEVTGQLDPDKYSRWSPRPENDEVAKLGSYLTVLDRISIVRKMLILA